MTMRELERKHNAAWRTVRKALDSAWPQPRKPLPPSAAGAGSMGAFMERSLWLFHERSPQRAVGRARRRPQAGSFVSMTKLISMTWPGKVSSVMPKTVLAGRWSPKYPRLPSAVAAAFCRRFARPNRGRTQRPAPAATPPWHRHSGAQRAQWQDQRRPDAV